MAPGNLFSFNIIISLWGINLGKDFFKKKTLQCWRGGKIGFQSAAVWCDGALFLMPQIISIREIVSEITISAVNPECTGVGVPRFGGGGVSIFINSGVILIISFMLLGASGARHQNSRSALSLGQPGKLSFGRALGCLLWYIQALIKLFCP